MHLYFYLYPKKTNEDTLNSSFLVFVGSIFSESSMQLKKNMPNLYPEQKIWIYRS